MQFKGYFEVGAARETVITIPLPLNLDEYDALQLLAVDKRLSAANYVRKRLGLTPPSSARSRVQNVLAYIAKSPDDRYRHIARLSLLMKQRAQR